MAETQVQKKEQEAVKKSQTATDLTYMPDVDICESGEQIRLTANMPGVDQPSVHVTVENNVLTIEGASDGVQEHNINRRIEELRHDVWASDMFWRCRS